MKYILPVIITIILCFSTIKKKNTYSDFLDGAQEGMKIVAGIFPILLAITVASSMLRSSGAFDMLSQLILPLCNKIGLPAEVAPLALMRPVSGSGSIALLSDTLNTYGADSKIGRISSIIMGSTETTFYCLGIYFSKTGIKKTTKALPCAIIGDICAIIFACIGESLF